MELDYLQGFLDEQYSQLEQLQDESSPHFVEEVISLFFDDSLKLLHNLETTLNKEPVDYRKVETCLHHLKGSSSSVGAQRIKNLCIPFRAFCQEKMRHGCLQCLQQVKQEYYLLKDKLQDLFQIEEQRAGGTISVLN
ncbi:histidine-containing phosphotransfer protein 1-like [Cryptomeria japonica]|uniref:histidine-containing phosphotransfer protein 1-like n=1 Tax=Cryptomeria japonica TaxID=3369 RepID=UPI0027DA7988|nr:histidine-containing phosphotransfer protein 1-like [Cryptomeria japonica]